MDQIISRLVKSLLTARERRRFDKVANKLIADDMYDMYLAQRIATITGNYSKKVNITLSTVNPMKLEVCHD